MIRIAFSSDIYITIKKKERRKHFLLRFKYQDVFSLSENEGKEKISLIFSCSL